MIPFIQLEEIQIGFLTIYVWGLFLALGVLITLILSLREARKRNFNLNLIYDAFIWLIIGLVIGSRVGHVLLYLDYYLSEPVNLFKLWEGGMTFHGGLIGIILAGLAFIKFKKLDWQTFLKGADIIALFTPLGIAVGRIGCSLINDHQGAETSLPWGIVWPDGIVRHPVAEYLILANLLIFFILRKKKRAFWNFLFLYSLARFFLDFTRSVGEPLSDFRYLYLSTAQWLSLIIILSIIIKRLIKGRFVNREKDNEED